MTMNKRIGKLLLLPLAFSAASCTLFINQQTPKGYVRYAVSLLDRDALYADRPEWKEKRAEVLAASVEDMDAAHRLIQEAAAVAGGKHSFIMAPVRDTTTYEEVAPEVSLLEGNLIHAVLPAHSGVKVSDISPPSTVTSSRPVPVNDASTLTSALGALSRRTFTVAFVSPLSSTMSLPPSSS